MPCYTMTQVTLELKKANLDWLEAALKGLGLRTTHTGATVLTWQNGSYDQTTGELIATEGIAAQIKQAYSNELVKNTVARYGMTLQQTAPNKYVAARRH